MDILSDTQRQIYEIQLHREHLENLYGRSVSLHEACIHWSQFDAVLYREHHPFDEFEDSYEETKNQE